MRGLPRAAGGLVLADADSPTPLMSEKAAATGAPVRLVRGARRALAKEKQPFFLRVASFSTAHIPVAVPGIRRAVRSSLHARGGIFGARRWIASRDVEALLLARQPVRDHEVPVLRFPADPRDARRRPAGRLRIRSGRVWPRVRKRGRPRRRAPRRSSVEEVRAAASVRREGTTLVAPAPPARSWRKVVRVAPIPGKNTGARPQREIVERNAARSPGRRTACSAGVLSRPEPGPSGPRV